MFNGIIYQQGTVSKFLKLNAGTKIFIKSKLKLDKKVLDHPLHVMVFALHWFQKKKTY